MASEFFHNRSIHTGLYDLKWFADPTQNGDREILTDQYEAV